MNKKLFVIILLILYIFKLVSWTDVKLSVLWRDEYVYLSIYR